MSSLANDLLNDFEDSGSEKGDLPDEQTTDPTDLGSLDSETEVADEEHEARKNGDGGEAIEDEEDTRAKVEKMRLGGVSDVRSVAGLMKTLQPVLEKIAHFQNIPAEQRSRIGNIEDDPEYKLLTQSNQLSTQIDSEIILVHKFIRDHYSKRFPELETLVANALDYAKTVAILKNGPLDNVKALSTSTDNLVETSLTKVLDGPTLMIVTVEGTTTKGVEMSDAELETTLRACKMSLELDKAKRTLTDYVQSRMTVFAPNLTAMLGSLTAAQLLNYAGGVTGLAKTPNRNIAALGAKRQTQTGFATNVGIRQQGFLYHSPIIQGIPMDYREKAMRVVSGKLLLAVRVDKLHERPDGSLGEELKQLCLDSIEKSSAPPPNANTRALPAPDDKPSRKRGGRRARKAKEATAMTDLRKQQNRMAFGKEEKEVGYGTGDGTKGLGMIGQENDGRIRAGQIDQRTRAKLSKKNAGWGANTSLSSGMETSLKNFGSSGGNASTLRAQGLRTSGVGAGAGAGTVSSVVFTPAQGLELVDPKVRAEIERKRNAEAAGYFSSGTFTQIGSGSGSGKADGGFKIPQLPNKKLKMDPPALPSK